MAIGQKGENLIFLISTPRTGSTLLQQLLSSHPQIHTLPETWIALPSLYTLYSRKIDRRFNVEYNLYWARTAIKEFIDKLPGKEEDYLAGIRMMYSHLYNRAIQDSGKQFFLDKGPRYYLIIPELYKVFPNATYIILLRNPLATLSSIINFVKWRMGHLFQFKHDLLQGPRRLLKGTQLLGDRCITIQYEKLLKKPDKEINKICEKLNVEFNPSMLSYDFKEEYQNSLGYKEQRDEYKSGRPDPRNIDNWQDTLKDPRAWHLANDYLNYLGKKIIEGMGYPYAEMKNSLAKHKPGWFKLRTTPALLRLMKKSEVDFMRSKSKKPQGPVRLLKRFLRRILK